MIPLPPKNVLELPGVVLESDSNHRVYRWGRYLIKVSEDKTPKIEGLRNEVLLLKALNIPHKFVHGNMVVMLPRGVTLSPDHFTIAMLSQVLNSARTIHKMNEELPLEEVDREAVYAYRRAAVKEHPQLQQVELTVAELLKGRDELPKKVLVHGDLHLGNVLDAGGRPALIDFESAHYSLPEWDWATLWLSLTVEGFPRLYLAFIEDAVDDPKAFETALCTKLATSLMWNIWKGDEAGINVRLQLAEKLLKTFTS